MGKLLDNIWEPKTYIISMNKKIDDLKARYIELTLIKDIEINHCKNEILRAEILIKEGD